MRTVRVLLAALAGVLIASAAYSAPAPFAKTPRDEERPRRPPARRGGPGGGATRGLPVAAAPHGAAAGPAPAVRARARHRHGGRSDVHRSHPFRRPADRRRRRRPRACGAGAVSEVV